MSPNLHPACTLPTNPPHQALSYSRSSPAAFTGGPSHFLVPVISYHHPQGTVRHILLQLFKLSSRAYRAILLHPTHIFLIELFTDRCPLSASEPYTTYSIPIDASAPCTEYRSPASEPQLSSSVSTNSTPKRVHFTSRVKSQPTHSSSVALSSTCSSKS